MFLSGQYRQWRNAMRFIQNNVHSLIYFSIGFVASALVSSLLEGIIGGSLFLVMLLIVFLVTLSAYSNVQSQNTVKQTLERLLVSTEYVHENAANNDIAYEGKVYKRLATLVRNANSEILYFSAGRNEKSTDEHDDRREFVDALIEAVDRNAHKGFKYQLIRQIPRKGDPVTLTSAMNQHCREILLRRERFRENQRFVLDMRSVEYQRLNSFMIIDKRQVVIFLTTDVRDDLSSVTSSALILNDNSKEIVDNMIWRFYKVMNVSQEVTLQQLHNESMKFSTATA
jgi:hypothetical protein